MAQDCTILAGDVLARLAELPDASVQCVVTSPPYWGLRDYGVAGQIGLEATPEAYLARMVAVFEQVRRVLRNDGTLWLNMGDSYVAHPNQRGVDDLTGKKQATNKGSRTAPSRSLETLPAKNLVGMPWRVAFALQAAGWWLRQDIIWHKPNPMPESVRDRCTKAHEYLFLLTKQARYFYDAKAVQEDATCERMRGPGPMTNPLNGDRNDTAEAGDYRTRRESVKRGGFNGKTEALAQEGRNAFRAVTETRNKRSVWTIATEPFPEAHFATFPRALVEPCIRAGSKPGDVVLDPFMGSGTVGAVALPLGRRFVGIELNPEYVKLARKRITKAVGPLFAGKMGA